MQRLIQEPIDPARLRGAFYMAAAFAFIIGACVGSFLNVCIYRMPLAGRSVMRPTFSFCFSCGCTLAWYDNLPLLSYLWLMGRCRRCGAVYSSRYFWIEMLCGAAYLGLFLIFGPSLSFLVTAIYFSLLVVVTFTDLDEYIIPDEISLGGFIAGLVLSVIVWLGPSAASPFVAGLPVRSPWQALLGAAAGAGGLYLIGWIGTKIFRKEAMGFGDVKLLGMMGTFIGPVNVVLTVFLASCIGAVCGLLQMLINIILKRKNYAHIPFGPYLAIAGFLILFIGPALLDLLLPPEVRPQLKALFFGGLFS
jgi:leader peptidase (prepilin peptidase)/N-methyltransferase